MATKKDAARQVAERLGQAHTELMIAGGTARMAKLPRTVRVDKATAEVALLRDYYAKLALPNGNGKKV